MFLQRLLLTNFKNYLRAELEFSQQLICFVGENGAGKTNLLDAIYYCCLGKSYFNPTDKANTNHEASFFRLEGDVDKSDKRFDIVCKIARQQKKQVLCNDIVYPRLSEHVGNFPVVMIAPDDASLIKGGSEDRRSFLDNTLAQTDRSYLEDLIAYNKALSQRNASLKQFAEKSTYDETLLAGWDEKLITHGRPVFEKRLALIEKFTPMFQQYYDLLVKQKEAIDCTYRSELLENDWRELLHRHREKDRILQRTTAGIHRDDLIFLMDGYPVKRFGSQGQQKSFLIALKLAQYEWIKAAKDCNPLLLLDDIFEKLDESRLEQLLHTIGSRDFGQIFITDAHPDRVQQIFHKFKMPYQQFMIRDGQIQGEDTSLKTKTSKKKKSKIKRQKS